jgi:hypothetical protein
MYTFSYRHGNDDRNGDDGDFFTTKHRGYLSTIARIYEASPNQQLE